MTTAESIKFEILPIRDLLTRQDKLEGDATLYTSKMQVEKEDFYVSYVCCLSSELIVCLKAAKLVSQTNKVLQATIIELSPDNQQVGQNWVQVIPGLDPNLSDEHDISVKLLKVHQLLCVSVLEKKDGILHLSCCRWNSTAKELQILGTGHTVIEHYSSLITTKRPRSLEDYSYHSLHSPSGSFLLSGGRVLSCTPIGCHHILFHMLYNKKFLLLHKMNCNSRGMLRLEENQFLLGSNQNITYCSAYTAERVGRNYRILRMVVTSS